MFARTLPRRAPAVTLTLTLALCLAVQAFAGILPASATDAGSATAPGGRLDPDKLAKIDLAIEAAIRRGEIPGAVFRMESGSEIYERAYGNRSLRPGAEPMTPDTIFDLASLTKVAATAPSILKLVEDGLVDLDAPVTLYLPELKTKAGTEKVTIRHLLTHTSGFPPVIRRREAWWGYDTGLRRLVDESDLLFKPGSSWRYSDVNYIALGEIVRRKSGQTLDVFAKENLYTPLGMADTSFLPGPDRLRRVAPTEDLGAYGVLRGEVHDQVSRRMGGAAGHAGLFGTAADLSRYVRLLLNGGELDGTRLFKPESVRDMISPQTPASLSIKRGLGWDIDSTYTTHRGEHFPVGGFGHTGWTGTAIWADPGSSTFYILLANRNHPTEAGRIKDLRITVGTLAAEAVGYPVVATAAASPAKGGTILNGIDVLKAENFAPLQGLKVGLITNHTGISRDRESTIDLLHAAPGVHLKALFSPEHGIRGTADASVDDEVDQKTGLPVYSLYKSNSRKPSAEELKGLDALVFDIQDIGCRFYTYISSMGHCMEAAAEQDLKFFLLDRVNPIGGERVEGPVRDGPASFTAYHDIPVRHGMTVGELARMFKAERNLEGLDLTVVPVRGWKRAQYFDETGLPWINPSPNMRNLTEAILYPGIGLLEFTKLSVGRGTDTPFEVIGAPYIDDRELAEALTSAGLPGIRFVPIRYTPASSVFAGEECGGVNLIITDRDAFRPIDTGLAIASTLHRLYPGDYNLRERFNRLLVHPATLDAVAEDKPLSAIHPLWAPELSKFIERRSVFLLY